MLTDDNKKIDFFYKFVIKENKNIIKLKRLEKK